MPPLNNKKKGNNMNYNDFELKNLSVDEQLSMSSAFPVLMRKVYVWMTLALVITGFTAYGVATSPGVLQLIFGNQILFWGMIIAELALVIGVSAAINRLSLTTATLMFILYSVINGALFSSIFLIYTASSIATVFFITAGRYIWSNGTDWIYDQNRPYLYWQVSIHGFDRLDYCHTC